MSPRFHDHHPLARGTADDAPPSAACLDLVRLLARIAAREWLLERSPLRDVLPVSAPLIHGDPA